MDRRVDKLGHLATWITLSEREITSKITGKAVI
jgi:hypothetical protein